MKKFRTAPVFTIEETSFVVDVDQQVLRQTNNLANEISFISDMQDRGTHYHLLYDLEAWRAAAHPFDQRRIRVIEVPQLTALDPLGMSEKYGIAQNLLQGKADFEVMVDQSLLELRRRGVLPRIDLAGTDFIIDVHRHELRHDGYPVISLKSFEISGDGWQYEAFYHPGLKQVVEIDPKLTEFPGGVIKLEIPNEIGLDPVATAGEYGIDERELLRRYPIRKDLKAKIVPLSETSIPALIWQNQEHLRQEHQEVSRQIKPRCRPYF